MDIAQTIVDTIFERCSSYITLLVPVALDDAVDGSDHHVMPDIKFSPLVEKRLFKIALNDICLEISIVVSLFSLQNSFDFLQIHAYCNPIPSVCELPWFYDPHISDRGSRRWIRLLFFLLLSPIVIANLNWLFYTLFPGSNYLGSGIVVVEEFQIFIVL